MLSLLTVNTLGQTPLLNHKLFTYLTLLDTCFAVNSKINNKIMALIKHAIYIFFKVVKDMHVFNTCMYYVDIIMLNLFLG